MKHRLFSLAPALLLAAGALLAGCGSPRQDSAGEAAGQPGQPIAMSVTSEGFQPAQIEARAGELLRLVITRRTDRTCAKEIVIKELGISKPLPLDQPVTIEITPKKTGQLRYACSMDMIAGVITVR